MNGKILTAIGLTLLLGMAAAAAAETVMIVSAENPATEATAAEMANFYVGKITAWKSGEKVIPLDQKKDTVAGKAFLAKIVRMSESDFRNLWVEKMLSGGVEPPRVVDSDQAVVDFVKVNKGAVGYVDAASVQAGVKVLPIDGAERW